VSYSDGTGGWSCPQEHAWPGRKKANAGGAPSKGTPKDKRLKENKAKVSKVS